MKRREFPRNRGTQLLHKQLQLPRLWQLELKLELGIGRSSGRGRGRGQRAKERARNKLMTTSGKRPRVRLRFRLLPNNCLPRCRQRCMISQRLQPLQLQIRRRHFFLGSTQCSVLSAQCPVLLVAERVNSSRWQLVGLGQARLDSTRLNSAWLGSALSKWLCSQA